MSKWIVQFFVGGAISLVLSACTAHYSCAKFPLHSCQDMSTVYLATGQKFTDYRHRHNNLESTNEAIRTSLPVMNSGKQDYDSIIDQPILKMPVSLRVWLAPWNNSDGDVEQAYLFVMVESGRWLNIP